MMTKRLIQLSGGFPWGFRLSQDHLGIRVQRVRPNSKAALNGLLEGDVVTNINQFDCRLLTLREVNYLIDQCHDILSLQISRFNHAKSNGAPTSDYDQSSRKVAPTGSGAIWNANSSDNSAQRRVATATLRGSGNVSDYAMPPPLRGPVSIYDRRPDEMQNAYRCTIEFVHNPASVKINSPQPCPVSPAIHARRQSRTPINAFYQSKGYTSDVESWHRSEFSLRPKLLSAERLLGHRRAAATNLYEQAEPTPLSRQPKFHVMRRASAEPTMSESSRRNSGTQTPATNLPVVAGGGRTVRRVRVPSEYEGELTNDQQKDIRKLGSSLKYQSRPVYSDSLFCRGAPGDYPTIEEQKRLAKRIAEILENVDASHGHRVLNTAAEENPPLMQAETRSAQTDLMAATEEEMRDELTEYPKFSGLPKCIEDSFRRISQDELLKSVASPPEFQVLHLQDHTTHTAVPPDICMNFARQLKYGPGKGAELFQRRKARSEKWVVDSSRLARMAPRVAFSDTEVRSPTLPARKRSTVAVRASSNTNHFNAVPKGWSSRASPWMTPAAQPS